MNQWTKRLLASGTILAAVTGGVVKLNEGYSERAYKDTAGVLTICYGETKGVKAGTVKTRSQCDAQLRESLAVHGAIFNDVPASVPDVVALGMLDMAYNIGVYGFNNSVAKQLILTGDFAKASEAVLSWRYITRNGKKYDCSQLVNGKPNKVCWGLWERRKWESKAIGNGFKTPQEALSELNSIYGK